MHRAQPLPPEWPTRRCHVEPFADVRPVVVTKQQAADMDETAEWAMSRNGCSGCSGNCKTAQACQQPEPENLSGFPLEPILKRHPWLGPVLVTCVVVVWTCIDAYLESTQ